AKRPKIGTTPTTMTTTTTTSTSKRRPTTKKSRTRRPKHRDPLRVQIAIVGKVPRKVKLTAKLMQSMIQRKAATGIDPKGLTLEIQRWQNPARKGAKRNWRTGNQADAWRTLRRALQRANVAGITVRRR